MRALWDEGPATIRELTEKLYPGGKSSHYGTVQKLLDRLEAKGFVRRTTEGRAHRFTAWVDRGELIARRVRATADELCEGSLTPLLTHLVSSSNLSPDEVAELRALVDRLEKDSKR